MTFIVYIKPECGFSQGAIQLLKSLKQKYKVHNVHDYGGTANVVRALKKNKYIPNKVNHTTVPIVFDNSAFVGGYSDLKTYLKKV